MNIDDLKKSINEATTEGTEYYWAGEKQLLVAILSSAMLDAKKTGKIAREATQFFMSNDEDYIFSFKSICDYLKIDPKQVLQVVGLKNRAPTSS